MHTTSAAVAIEEISTSEVTENGKPESPETGTTEHLGKIIRLSPSSRDAAYDAGLVQRFNAGDAAAFEEIVSRHREKIFHIALGLLRNRSDAEEIVQDTFIRAHRGLGQFRGDSSLATWLHHIAVNLSRNRYWYFFRRRRQDTLSLNCPLSESGGSTFADLITADVSDPARDAATSEFSALINTCMEKLEAGQREILTLRSVLNQQYTEIAATLGIEVGTVKSRIARARGKLRALLAEECPEFSLDASPSDWFEPNRRSDRLDLASA